MFRAAIVEVEVEVEFEKLVVLVKIAVLFPNVTLTMARRTMPAVMDALALVIAAPDGLPTLDCRLGAAVEVGSVCNVRISGVELRVVGSMGCWVDGLVNSLLDGELEAAILELKFGVDKTTADDDGVRSAEDERSRTLTDELLRTTPSEEGQLVLVAVIVDVTVVVVVV